MNIQRPPFFRQGRLYEFNGYVREIFGYRELLFSDNFLFGIRHQFGDHVIMVSDNRHEIQSIIEINQVLSVRAVCQYGHSYAVEENYSPFEFRVFSFDGVIVTSMFFVPENGTYERRVVEAEREDD